MIILDGRENLPDNLNTKICLGKFDGIHLGHRKLISEMCKNEDGLKSLVFTFAFASPVSFSKEGHIYSEKERRDIFEKLGVEYLVEYIMDETTAHMESSEFIKSVLLDRLHVKSIYCGPDISFGYKGKGNLDLLKKLSYEYGFSLEVFDKVKYDGTDISSTRIRKAIKKGKVSEAEIMLGKY